MNRKIINIAAVAAIVVFAAGCSQKSGRYDATGSFEATEVVVSSEVNGRIIDFGITEGSELAAGEQVGQIDSTQLALQKVQLENNIKALRSNRPDISSQLAPLEEQLAKQKREKQRVENLLKADVTTQRQLDDITSAITVLEKQLSAQRSTLSNSSTGLEAQVAAAEAQLAQLADQITKSSIKSPIKGIVSAKYAQQGELAIAGKPLMKVSDVDNIYLKAYLLSSQLADVKLGQKVKVYADFGGGEKREYDGKIMWVSERSEFTPKNIVTSDDRANMVYAVKIAVPNDGFLKIGMYGGVRLQ